MLCLRCLLPVLLCCKMPSSLLVTHSLSAIFQFCFMGLACIFLSPSFVLNFRAWMHQVRLCALCTLFFTLIAFWTSLFRHHEKCSIIGGNTSHNLSLASSYFPFHSNSTSISILQCQTNLCFLQLIFLFIIIYALVA